MKKEFLIITGAGLVIGFAEALVYYNMGKRKEDENFRYSLPKGEELTKTMAVVLVTSLLTAGLTAGIEKLIRSGEPQPGAEKLVLN